MVTYADLFSFVIMLCAVITLVITIFRHKKQHPRPGKLKCYFYKTYFTSSQAPLAFGSLAKYIICNVYKIFNYKIEERST